ncbi:MAG: response regulator [Thermodesulfobacteriota bacterium]|nr:response regulator [Thermodesulfobacteriota bacterium]
MNKILFVDDDPNLLRGLRRGLRPLSKEWEMFFVGSGKEALEFFANTPVDIVISDYRMPEMSGFELLTRIRRDYPQTVRIILTGQPDMETYAETISVCHYFLWKPIELEALKPLLQRIKTLDSVLNDENLKRKLCGLTTLPTLPEAYLQLTRSLSDPDSDARAIGRIVKSDMSLMMQLLKLVNSAGFGLVRKIDTLEEAIQYLGLNTLRSLVLSQKVFSMTTPEENSEFGLPNLWKHSLCVSRLAEALKKTDSSSAVHDKLPLAYASIGGLLHDIGKLVLAHCLPQEYRQVHKLVAEQQMSYCQAERQVIGADHAAIGGYLATLWGLPSPVVEAICLHDKEQFVDLDGHMNVADAVWHANQICQGNFNHSADQWQMLQQNRQLSGLLEECEKEAGHGG